MVARSSTDEPMAAAPDLTGIRRYTSSLRRWQGLTAVPGGLVLVAFAFPWRDGWVLAILGILCSAGAVAADRHYKNTLGDVRLDERRLQFWCLFGMVVFVFGGSYLLIVREIDLERLIPAWMPPLVLFVVFLKAWLRQRERRHHLLFALSLLGLAPALLSWPHVLERGFNPWLAIFGVWMILTGLFDHLELMQFVRNQSHGPDATL